MNYPELERLLDKWAARHLTPVSQKVRDYIADYFTKSEAVRHSDNLQNMFTVEGVVAILKLNYLAELSQIQMKSSDFRLSAALLAKYDFTLTPEQKYHNIRTDIFYNSHENRKVILYPDGWRGFELVENLVGNGFEQIFRGEVNSIEEFEFILKSVNWLDRFGKLHGVDYIEELPPLGS